MEKALKKKSVWKVILIILAIPLILWMVYGIIRGINTKSDMPSSVVKNCEVIHNIYLQDEIAPANRSFSKRFLCDWDEYRAGTLFNFGLCEVQYADDKQHSWNGAWVIDEDFVKTYVEMYSVEEFFEIYQCYIVEFFKISNVADYIKNNEKLFEKITQTNTMLLSMTDVFDVTICDPVNDKVLNQTSETEEVSGKFNEGRNNKVVYKSDTMTKDTYEYEGYTVVHRYGAKYCQGSYGWVAGEFKDVKPYFSYVDEYYLSGTDVTATSLEGLACRFIRVGNYEYKEYTCTKVEGKYGTETLDEPVTILSTVTSLPVSLSKNK